MIRMIRKTAPLCVALALVLMALPAFAEGDYQAVVTAASMNVYSQESPYEYLGALPVGTAVTVKAASGDVALISCGGRTGLARLSDMSPAPATGVSEPAVHADAGRPVVAAQKTRLYKKASKSSRYTTVKAGASMQLLAVNGDCAKVSYKGKVRYAVYSHLAEPDAAQSAPATVETVNSAPVQTGNAPVVTAQSARIYSGADSTGDYVTVGKGTALTLLAIRGDCAMVERDGAIGYTEVSALKSASRQAETKTTANPFSPDSNEYQIYAFMVTEMGYNRAAAMGVLANIKYESSYNPDCNGDGGTSYGICQWHAGRKTNLISWCEENLLDYTTLDAQLRFFKYEITSRYASVHSYLRDVENSADGAYDAGYYFCFNYEAPAARTSQSTKRGTYARDTLYAK